MEKNSRETWQIMADVIGLSDVSSKDTGKGSKLKTGNLKRSYNMPKDCVAKKIAGGMKSKAAHAACYPAGKKGSLKRAVKSVQASVGGMKARRGIKKYEKKSGKLPQPY